MQRFMLLAVVIALITGVSMATTASAATADLSYTAFGNATVTPDGVVVTSDASSTPQYGGLSFKLPPDGIDFDQLQYVGTEHEALEGNCGGGSPRFVLQRDDDKVAIIYLGDAPSFTTCPDGDTGNLLDSTDSRCDLSRIGGTQVDDCANLAAAFEGHKITGIFLIVDGSWLDGTQSFLFNPTVTVDVGDPYLQACLYAGSLSQVGVLGAGEFEPTVNCGRGTAILLTPGSDYFACLYAGSLSQVGTTEPADCGRGEVVGLASGEPFHACLYAGSLSRVGTSESPCGRGTAIELAGFMMEP